MDERGDRVLDRKMAEILASVIDGVLIGAVYGLAAMGLTLIWGVMNVINLSHGAIIVLGMFALYYLSSVLGLYPYAALPIVIVIGFVAGVLLYWVAVHRVIGRPPLMSLLSTFAVNMVLIGLGTALVEHQPIQRSGFAAERELARAIPLPARISWPPRSPS